MSSSPKVYKLYEMLKDSLVVGNRIFPNGIEEMDNLSPGFTWYQKGAYSIPHSHPEADAVYYFGFEGEGEAKARILIGWPLSRAEDYIVTGPTMMAVPRGVVHTSGNLGTKDITLVRIYSPAGLRATIDAENGQVFYTNEEYKKNADLVYAESPTFDDYIGRLKRLELY